MVLVDDHTLVMVSLSHAWVRSMSLWPPHRSATISPSTVTATEAPTSKPSSKFAAMAARTASNLAVVVPWISVMKRTYQLNVMGAYCGGFANQTWVRGWIRAGVAAMG